MVKRIDWNLMRPEDIELRPAQVKDGRVTLLAYQNGRTTMDALDSNFGEFGWKLEYKDVAGQIYGRLSIKDPETGEWIYKEDTGEESNISASKGQSTDILKRLAVRFGYGRELYSIPKIVLDDDGYGNHYKVSEIEWDENRECTHIQLVNRFGKVVYTDDFKKRTGTGHSIQMSVNKKPNSEILRSFCSVKKVEQGVDLGELTRFFDFYKDTVDKWDNTVMPEKLWTRWEGTRRTS